MVAAFRAAGLKWRRLSAPGRVNLVCAGLEV